MLKASDGGGARTRAFSGWPSSRSAIGYARLILGRAISSRSKF